MGSCFSQPEQPKPPKLTNAQKAQIAQNVVIPDATWEVDETWAAETEVFRQSAIEAGGDISNTFQSTMFKRAADWLNKKYPECARVGSAEVMGEQKFMTTYGCCRYPTDSILTLDDDFTGVIYAFSIVVAVPIEGDKEWPKPGEWLDSPDIQGAKQAALRLLAVMAATSEANTKHVDLRIFIGADLVTCKFNPTNKQPTMTKLASGQSKNLIASTKSLNRQARAAPDQWRGMFRSTMFMASLNIFFKNYPGCTVWDEGEMPFKVGEELYPHPTRLLIARRFEDMSPDVEATHFRVIGPMSSETDPKWVLLRNTNPEKEPGGILAISLLVLVPENDPWPLFGTYAKSPAMLAAANALAGMVQRWNMAGKLQRCLFEVHMGVDIIRYKFVGEKFEAVAPPQDTIAKSAKQYDDLNAFYIKLDEQKKHELFDSESQFQAIKREILERNAQDPERYNAMLPMIALGSATTFLEMNFPGCEVSDEGEFPATVNGQIIRISGTRLVVAKEKGKEKHNVIAAMYCVPSPDGTGFPVPGKSWLNTKEMKAADDMLLSVLKKWYTESKIADDCMAQVMMGMDATIYKFVDGVKFEDYSDERMAQLKWG